MCGCDHKTGVLCGYHERKRREEEAAHNLAIEIRDLKPYGKR